MTEQETTNKIKTISSGVAIYSLCYTSYVQYLKPQLEPAEDETDNTCKKTKQKNETKGSL